jgi:interleukin-1 receptor-associated kinase 1
MFLIADNAADGLDCFSLQVLKAATSNFSIQNKLGEGGFGEVFKVHIASLSML